jgi:hypothetical protein
MVIGDTVALSQPTISRIVFRVSALLASLIRETIKMPTTQERKNENYQLFRILGYGNGAIGLPGIDGAIDCTHIRLTHTRFYRIDEVYRNRKGYFSLNVQVCYYNSSQQIKVILGAFHLATQVISIIVSLMFAVVEKKKNRMMLVRLVSLNGKHPV